MTRSMRSALLVICMFLFVPAAGAQELPLSEQIEVLERRLEELRERTHEALELDPPDALESRLQSLDESREMLRGDLASMRSGIQGMQRFLGEMREFAGPCRELTAEEGVIEAGANKGMRPPAPPILPADLQERFQRHFSRLDAARDQVAGALRDAEPELIGEGRDRIRNRVMESLEHADAVLERRNFLERRANWMMRVRDKLPSLDRDTPPCIFLMDILPSPGEYTLAELKDEPFAPVRDLIESGRRIHAYHAETLRQGDWAVALGTIWTPLDAPEWNVHENATGQRTVNRSAEKNRSGLPVLLVEFSPPQSRLPFRAHLRPYVELGTSLDWDRPAFLVGGAAKLGPFFRVGVGYGFHLIEMPDDGIGDGDLLRDGAALRLRDEWEGDLYVSFSIGLGELHRWRTR